MDNGKVMQELISMCKQRGYIFPGSQIYGGLSNTWDYGPLGVELKNNVKQQWWKHFVERREDVVGLDSGILLHPKVWEASGHLKSFNDPLVDCKSCKERFRADHILENKLKTSVEGKTNAELNKLLKDNNIGCPRCGNKELTESREFNLMFKTFQGVVEERTTELYMRPETAQGIFVNFKNVLRSSRKKLPFGIAQIGKAFRNEITPGNFTYRTREFEQMEIEYFVKPNEESKYFEEWVNESMNWFLSLSISKDNLRLREHGKEELSHYSNKTLDIEYKFPFGWGELEGIASRGDYDLRQHAAFGQEELAYKDPQSDETYIPYVVEPSFGVDRTILTFLLDAYKEEEAGGVKRRILKLNRRLSPIKAGILPLKRNEVEIVKTAKRLSQTLSQSGYSVQYDDTGSIGKLYRRQDEIGTPFCITVDYDSLKDESITIRERDSMRQERIKLNKASEYLAENLT